MASPQGREWQMDTEEETVALLREEGYVHDFVIHDGRICCPDCDESADPRTVRIDATHRFEGVSNPGDEAVVFALSGGPCGHRGVLVSAFGPDVPAEQAEAVRVLGRDAPEAEPEDDPITAREAAEQALIETGESDAGAELGDEID